MPLLKVQDFNKLISSRKLSPIYLFIGEESYLIDLCLKKTEKFLAVNDLNKEIFYASEVCVEDILNSLKTLPFLNDKRMIVVKAINKIKAVDAEKLISYLSNIVETSCLVLLYSDNLNKETLIKRREFVDKCINSENCVSVDCRKRFKNEINEFIRSEFALRGKFVTDDVILKITDENDTSLLNISNEIERLSLFVGKNKKDVTRDDLEKISGYAIKESAHALSLNLESKDLEKSVFCLEKLVNMGEEPLILLSVISSSIRRMLNAKSMLEEQGIHHNRVAFTLCINRFYAKIFFSNLRKHNIKSLKESLKMILKADTIIKTSNTNDSVLILEEVLLFICKN